MVNFAAMLRFLTFPLRLFAFWLLFFAAFRIWFILWFRHEWNPDEPGKVWLSLWHALPLDLSMAGYLIALPVLAWFVGWAAADKVRSYLHKGIIAFNTFFYSGLIFLFGANLFLYEEWHTPLNNRALEYMKDPSALLDSMSPLFILACALLYAGAVWALARVYSIVTGEIPWPTREERLRLVAIPVWLCALPLAIRGGTGVMPVNESAVYYSSHLFDNHAAINAAWHLVHSMVETRSSVNHFRFAERSMAEGPVKNLLNPESATVDSLLETDSTPVNLVFIVMESMTAQVVEMLGGEKGVCPNMNTLAGGGLLFTNCYSSGYRTDQGLVSVLAGYPAQPDQSIVLLEDKASKLRSVPAILSEKGYSTLFMYGGELTFANIGVWLTQQRFKKIISETDFDSADKTQRWGVDDQKLLTRAVNEISVLQQPFFATALTLSLHPPYDVPRDSRWNGTSDRDKFLNSAAFADYALGEFFRLAQQQSWYSRTLFVIVADHGASLPAGAGPDNPVARQVPLIVFGEPLKSDWKGKTIDGICNHHDIPATILSMLNMQEENAFPWSRNLCNITLRERGFAFYNYESGMGWINGNSCRVFYFGDGTWKYWYGLPDGGEEFCARAYLQELYYDFLEK